MSTTNTQMTVGVDTGKDQLDIFIRPSEEYFTVPNNQAGIRDAIKRLKALQPNKIVIEATGRLEYEFVYACAKANLPIAIANPYHVKKFAQAAGQRAKTDKLDAALIAYYGELMQPRLSTVKAEDMRKMSDLLIRRSQMIKLQTMEKNRAQIMPKETQASIKALLKTLKREIDKLDQLLFQLIETNPDYQEKANIIMSVKGVGKVAALTLLSQFPELGYISNKQAASLTGVAPMNKESGRYQGVRKIQGGRHQIRTVLYMGMMSAIQSNPVFKEKYQTLITAGKPKKVALIACVRKMIVTLNAMLRDGQKWNPESV